MISNATARFSSRVENYRRYRPGYPAEVLDVLRAECGLARASVVADIGSGTGIFSELLLKQGYRVIGIEPNDEMRAAAESTLGAEARFTSVRGSAEATTLAGASVDLITAAQAFHWFDRVRTRAEFARILKPGGWVALIWNERETASTPFLVAYENLLQVFATDYLEVRQQDLDLERVREFVGSGTVKLTSLQNSQVFDYAGLEGRLLSSSYAPENGHPGHGPMLEHLRELFGQYAVNGVVEFKYDTQVYCAQL